MTLPYAIFPAILRAIDLIGQGYTKTKACDQAGLSVAVFNKHTRDNVDLAEMLEEAEERGYDAMADALVDVDKTDPDNPLMLGHSNPQVMRLLSDNVKWLLEKRKPKNYGNRVEVKHEVTLDRAILDALNAARNRTLLPAPSHVEDAEAVFLPPIMPRL